MWTEPLPADVAEPNVSMTCPLGLPGETRWCRESLIGVMDTRIDPEEEMPITAYEADRTHLWTEDKYRVPWPGGQRIEAEDMPREYSRFTITIQSVTIERRGGRWCWVAKVEVMK